MDKFILMTNRTNIAQQIAEMLNSYNNLSIIHTSSTILNSKVQYIIDQDIVNNQMKVVGCVGLCPTNYNTTLIQHLCVEKNKRNMGIALKLVNTAISNSTTDYVHMNIRNTNYPSLNLSEKLGFLIITQKQKLGYNVVTVGRDVNGRKNRLY